MNFSPKFAILCPVHHGADRILEQVKNYNHFWGSECVHILHISKESASEYANLPKGFFPSNVMLNFDSWPTNHRCVVGAFISNSRLIMGKSFWNEVEYVYIHTDSDLLVFGQPCKYVRFHKNVYSARPVNPNWVHYQRMMSDNRFSRIRSRLGVSDNQVFFGRQEGAFFEKSVWQKIVHTLEDAYDTHFLGEYENTWPVEEVGIPTIAAALLHERPPRANVIVKTKPLSARGKGIPLRKIEDNLIQPHDIIQARLSAGKGACIALKLFSEDLAHPSRTHLGELLSFDRDEE